MNFADYQLKKDDVFAQKIVHLKKNQPQEVFIFQELVKNFTNF